MPDGSQITDSTPPGGMFAGGEPGEAKVWFEVDDIEAALARVREFGGVAGEAGRSPRLHGELPGRPGDAVQRLGFARLRSPSRPRTAATIRSGG